jgi:c-di-GMP-binding flagellar brake protein YcgR
MASPTEIRFSPRTTGGAPAPSDLQQAAPGKSGNARMPIERSRLSVTMTDPSFRVMPANLAEFKDRRRRRRVAVQPMYTTASVRVLSRKGGPLEGHIVDLSETGMVVEVDERIGVGQPVTVEFAIAGLGRLRANQWPTFAVAGEVVRLDNLEDFPNGPYRTAVRFVRIATMAQAQIARFVVMQPTIS